MSMNEYTLLYAMIKDLKLIQQREARRQDQYKHLTRSTSELLDEIVDFLEADLESYEEGYQ